MDKTYENGMRDGRITAVEEQQIRMQDLVLETRKEMIEAVNGLGTSIRNEFEPMSKALLGNGDTEKGLCTRFAVLSAKVFTNRKLFYLVITLLIASIVKDFF